MKNTTNLINKMFVLISLVSILIIPAFTVTVDSSNEIPTLDDLLLWVFSNPVEEPYVKDLYAWKFHADIQKIKEEYLMCYKSSNVTGAIQLLDNNIKTAIIDWAAVFAKIQMKKAAKQGEHGLPSLVAWALQETGPGTEYPSIRTGDLIKFLLNRKVTFTILLSNGKVKSLIKHLNKGVEKYSSSSVDWETIIHNLKDHRQLLKYACGLMNLELCDITEQ